MPFDPDRHSLSAAIRYVRSQGHDHVLLELIEELGFPLEEDLHEDSLLSMIEDDRSGIKKIWSNLKSYDEEIDYSELGNDVEGVVRVEPSGGLTRYRVIYADPPWSYRNKKTGGSHKSGAVQHYRTMTMGELKTLPVWQLAEPTGCVLFMWGTVPMPRESLETMEAWGFEYKTRIFWEKLGRLGMGYWFRGQVEELLVGVRGPVSAFRYQAKNIIRAKPRNGEHSAKPIEVRNFIDRVTREKMPNAGYPKIELFSREIVPGWDHWGDEVLSPVRLVDGKWVSGQRVEAIV